MRTEFKRSLLPLLYAAALAFAPACGGADSTGGTTASTSPDAGTADTSGGGDAGAASDADPATDDVTEPTGADATGPDEGDATDPVEDDITEPPAGAACDNPEDQLVADTALDEMLSECAPPCLDEDDAGACLEGCADQAGFATACAECFRGLGTCVKGACGDLCSSDGEGDEACGPCIQANCATDFAACSGLDIFEDEPPGPELPGGLCVNPQDGALIEEGADATCFQLCISQADPASCMDDCFSEAGFSEACSECGGKVMGCVADNCPEACTEETTSADDGEACGICATQTCGAEFAECFSNAGEGDPDVGDCVNPVDLPLLDASANTVCDTLCIADPAPDECTVDCYQEAGFTEVCSECAGELIGCLADNCPGACTDEGFAADEGEACLGCLFGTCGEEFNACYQDSTPEPEPETEWGICLMGDDGALMDSPDDPAGQCWTECQPYTLLPGLCMAECLAEAGFSEPCTDCATAFATCVWSNCPEECPPEVDAADDGPCGECVVSKCNEEMNLCFATPEPANEFGQCGQPQDAALFGAMDEETSACVYGDCWDAADPQSCAEVCYDDAGFSGGCANCLGELAGCLASECTEVCSGEGQSADDGAACGQCMFTSCAEEFGSCFEGTQPAPEPGICLLDPDDVELISAPGDAVGYCFGVCQYEEEGACMADCMMEAGFTVACSECAGEFTNCVIDNCANECSVEAQNADGGQACGECMGPACGSLWPTCFEGVEEIPEETGLCVNPADTAIDAAAGNNGFGICWGECMSNPDTEACVTDCMTAGGYSTDCTECVVEFATCMADNCGTECTTEFQSADGGEACGLCVALACSMQYGACYAGSDPTDPEPEPEPQPQPESGLCLLDPQDIEAISEPGDAIGFCFALCLDEEDGNCTADCMMSAGFTDTCSACAGEFTNCVAANCAAECSSDVQAEDGGEACGACVGPTCSGLWPLCFLGIDTVEEDPGYCVNEEDGAIDDAAGVDGLGLCWDACQGDPDTPGCALDCMLDAQYSSECANCVGDFVSCVTDNCGPECSPEGQAADGGEGCSACMAPACGMAHATCYSGDTDETAEEIACGSEEDVALLEDDDNPAWTCAWTCIEDGEPAGCMLDCTMAAGFSDGCAFCFGFAGSCLAANCAEPCSEDGQVADGGQACDACIADSCVDIWDMCFP